MHCKKKLYIILTILWLGMMSLKAQETIPASGIDISGNGGSASCTIGQIVCGSNSSGAGSVAHGVQQAFEISVIYGIEESSGISLAISSYPNPVSDLLILKVEDFDPGALTFKLFNSNGKLIESGKPLNNVTIINMSHYNPASYILKVSEKKDGTPARDLKTFIIIKK